MADEQDQDSKTEDPSGKKLNDAREQGNLAKSQEINHWFIILSAALIIMIFAGNFARVMQASMLQFVATPHAIAIDPASLSRMLVNVGGGIAAAGAPIFILIAVFALAANFVQNPPGFTIEKLMPDVSRISPMAGFKRIFSVNNLVEFGKGLVKVTIVGTVAYLVVRPEIENVNLLIGMDMAGLLAMTSHVVMILLTGVLSILFLIAAADVLYQRFAHTKQLRMTKQEVKDEHRQSEGDPKIKARLRAIRYERARKRMMAAVPQASVVITNPTHYAVALKYEPGAMGAPRVVAKGADLVAKRIRELATANNVPLVENPPLARALFTVDLDQEIPVEHYKTVAEIIGYVMRLRKGPASITVPGRASR